MGVGHDTGVSCVLLQHYFWTRHHHKEMKSHIFALSLLLYCLDLLTQELLCLGYSRAEALCKEYRQTKGPGTTAKPSEQLFFLKLGGLIKNTLEKCQRENGFM